MQLLIQCWPCDLARHARIHPCPPPPVDRILDTRLPTTTIAGVNYFVWFSKCAVVANLGIGKAADQSFLKKDAEIFECYSYLITLVYQISGYTAEKLLEGDM